MLCEFELIAPHYDVFTYWGMILFVFVTSSVVFGKLRALFPNHRRLLALGAILILSVPVVLTWSGVLTLLDATPPPFLMVPIYLLFISGGFAFSKLGKKVNEQVSLMAIVGLQAFRLPLEMYMHEASERGIMPQVLSYRGLNFDIITGIGAIVLLLIWMVRGEVSKALIWIWNVFGLACLAMIFFIAVSSSPVLRAWGDEPEKVNSWVLYFPYIWLPTVLVVIAVVSHLLITRRLISGRNVEK